MISKDDWHSWANHPVTRIYKDLVQQAMAEIEFVVDLSSVEKTALEAAYRSGVRFGLQEALEMEPEEFDEDLSRRD